MSSDGLGQRPSVSPLLRGAPRLSVVLPRPPTAPAMLFVHFNNMTTHEEMLNSMLHQALASVLEAENGLSNALHDLFMASMNLGLDNMYGGTHSTSPKTSSTFLNTLQDHWWSQLPSSDTCNSDCPICLSDFAASDLVINLPCHHTFHSTCGLPWLQEHNVCPTCRFQLPTDDVQSTPKQTSVARPGSSMLEALPTEPDEARAPEPVSRLPGTTNDDTPSTDSLLDDEANALVADNDMENLVDEILDEVMEVEATSVVQQVQRQRQRLLELDRILDEVIRNDTVE
ncbi:hypothetical protein H310_05137 [Aphanomyces invadans]|uniref:RING-type domain-containing protein n=1 Tax=Aphanomyces invadans TaxID=157072 RepID=A0A024UBI9_9STRA|nr:hypothetical protein H310_05137 [Aphanomyces invadans]ETW03771.1 hypothetical protein H310_05137 [Aphanomyces invadans]|eukprot:XP_008868000.1 hypothetical protein H310_05137 [Aphanomyces invadans]